MRISLLSIACGAVIAVGACTPAPGNHEPQLSKADTQIAEARLLDGLNAQQETSSAPDIGRASSQASILAAHPSQGDRVAMKTRAAEALGRHFSGAALVDVVEAGDRGIDALADPSSRALGGGADSLHITNTKAEGETGLLLTGTVRMWSDLAQVQGDKAVLASPSNVVDFRSTMRKQPDGTWMISAYTWKFHPGSEP